VRNEALSACRNGELKVEGNAGKLLEKSEVLANGSVDKTMHTRTPSERAAIRRRFGVLFWLLLSPPARLA